MNKTLKEMMEEIQREPVPYEGLRALAGIFEDGTRTSDANPKHRGDYSRVLSAAAQAGKSPSK